jgi:type IV pilus assembly protein PilM
MSTPRVLAVDSGAGHVACGVFASAKAGRLTLEQFALESFNPDAALEAQWSEFVSQSLETVSGRAKLSGPATLSVPGHLTLTKFIKTPAVDKTKREKVIQFEAQQNIPYPLKEVVWDHLAVSDDGLDLEVMLAAVKLDVMEDYCRSVSSVGFSVDSVSPSPLALYRAFKYNYPEVNGSVLVVNIGARSTNLLFIDGAKFFVRTINLAGNSVTQSIADEVKQDFAQAESLKLQVLGGRSDLPEASPARAAVLTASHAFAGRLHLEITRSTVNYRRTSGAEQPAAIYITGGGSLVPDLVPTLAEKLKSRVERFDPLRNVDVAPAAASARDFSAVLADLVGLATRAIDKAEPAFTLLPPAITKARAFRKQQPVYLAAAAVVVVALALPILHFQQRANVALKQSSILDTEISPLRALRDENVNNLQKIETIKKEVAAIQGLVETKSNWINFFTDLQERLVKVEDVWLEKLQVLRPAAGDLTALPVGGAPAADPDAPKVVPVLRLNLSGRLLDKNNPVSKVSQDSYSRVKSLLASFANSQFISAVESERFDSNQPGILRFDFTLVVNPQKPL